MPDPPPRFIRRVPMAAGRSIDPASGRLWKPLPAPTDPEKPWMVDLARFFGGDNRVAYLKTTIHSKTEQTARLEMGSDDGIKLWLNGELVHAVNAARGVKRGEDVKEVTLKAGENHILVKVNNYAGPWGVAVRVRAPDGTSLEGLDLNP